MTDHERMSPVDLARSGAELRQRRYDAATRHWSAREARLVREAAVMGYVLGTQEGKRPDPFPRDEQVMFSVVSSALALPELYPTINGRPLPGTGTTLSAPDLPKGLRETLCVAQSAIALHPTLGGGRARHVDRLSRLIAECDRHRPIGPDGKHGNRHTPTCGCEDTE